MHAMRIICNKEKYEDIKQFFPSNKILNIYKLNILGFVTHLRIRLIKKLLRMFFFDNSKNRLILTQLDSRK